MEDYESSEYYLESLFSLYIDPFHPADPSFCNQCHRIDYRNHVHYFDYVNDVLDHDILYADIHSVSDIFYQHTRIHHCCWNKNLQ